MGAGADTHLNARSMTGWQVKSAAQRPLRRAHYCRVIAIATVTFFVHPMIDAQSLASAAPTAAKISAIPVVPPPPLPVDTAFPLLASFDKQGNLALKVDVLPGHYLYRDRFEFSRDGGAGYAVDRFKQGKEAVGKTKHDPNFGVVTVYETPLTLVVGQSASPKTVLTVSYQGCSELAGVCYPPVRRTFELVAGARDVPAKEAAKSTLSTLFKKNTSQ